MILASRKANSKNAKMTKNRNNDQVGDAKTPALQPAEVGLRVGTDQAEKITADNARTVRRLSAISSVALIAQQAKFEPTPVKTCKQILWFSFFFDGTGNNRYADEGMHKHSNVAKLFRVHKANDPVQGTYAFYLQGVGTYFPEIGDDGGSLDGLSFGRKGAARLDYALRKFDEAIKRHLELAKASSNAILEINISVFGFSRGAALARAFVNLLLDERCTRNKGKVFLKDGLWPLRIRFVGLFDTVASVGLPMSNNTTSKIGAAFSSVRYVISDRLSSYSKTRPIRLAYSDAGMPGADPAPGRYDGHGDWGNKLIIDPIVEEVRHFIAAHEVRNSFPVDSVSILQSGRIYKPEHFFETVYPGVHSDVGGELCAGRRRTCTASVRKLGRNSVNSYVQLRVM